MNELLLVLRIIYSLLNKANHVKVEAHMAPPPPPSQSSQFPNTQYIKYKTRKNNIVIMHRNYQNKNEIKLKNMELTHIKNYLKIIIHTN
jgi:hypothetical protein